MHTHAHPFTSGLVGAQDPTTSRLSRLQTLVVIGDAFQSVCPATGTGLTRVLTDVDVLCNECIPDWLATPGMGPEKIDRFYTQARDRSAIPYRRDILPTALHGVLRAMGDPPPGHLCGNQPPRTVVSTEPP